MCVFIFLLLEQKKNETKRKFAGSRSGAKKWRFFLNEKNSLRSNSFSFLTLHTSPFISRSKSEPDIKRNIASLVEVNVFHVFPNYLSFLAKRRIQLHHLHFMVFRTKSSHQHISSKSYKKTKTNNERSNVNPPLPTNLARSGI